MDNYFILSSKFGDKWTKVTSDMTSVKLGTCIHIMKELISLGDFLTDTLPTIGRTIILTITFHKEFTVIPVHTQLSSQ
jgi:hypothetical protein